MASLPEPPLDAPPPPTIETIWEEHREFIRRWLRRLGIEDQDLGDVTSDVFATIMRSLSSYDPHDGELRGWIFRITERCAKRHLAHMRARGEIRASAPAAEPATSEDSTVNRLLVDKLLQEIEPEKRRLVFVAYALQDMTIDEICDAFSVPENTARTWIRRSREDFEKAYKRHQAELARIGAAVLPFSAFVLLALDRDPAALPGAGRSPRRGWSGFELPTIPSDLASHVGTFIAGAAAMFALLHSPPRPTEFIEPERSPAILAPSFAAIQPIPAGPILPAPAQDPPPAKRLPIGALNAAIGESRGAAPDSLPAEEHTGEALIRGAEAACAHGDFEKARLLIDHHESEFPKSRFAFQRERIRANSSRGIASQAK